MVGGIAQLEFARMFAVEISPTFVLKGGGYQGSDGGTDVAKYSELDFPILFKVIFLQGRFRPYGFAGPNLGIMLSATRSAAPAQGQSQDIDIKSGTSGIDFSLDFGGGCEFEVVKNIGLFLDARYSLGLSNLNSPASPNNQQQAQGQTAPSIKANGFQIMIGSLYHI